MFNTTRAPRIIAGCLAIGGLFWSVILWPFLFDDENDLKVRALELHLNPLAVLVFGPCYVVTAGYIIRAATTLSLGIRRATWVLSLLVQGTWLGGHVLSALTSRDPIQQLVRPFGIVAWLIIATLMSAGALVFERQQVATLLSEAADTPTSTSSGREG